MWTAGVAGMLLLVGHSAQAGIAGLELVADGLSNPTFVTFAPGVPNRLFATEQGGAVKVIDTTDGSSDTFLTVDNTDAFFEGGLLGLAFHPEYSMSGSQHEGKFYVYATLDEGNPFTSHVQEYTVSGDPDVANPTPREILNFAQPAGNHNAGWIGFSPNDGYLYIATGDGGASSSTAQDRSNLLGNILRVDIAGDDFASDDFNYSIPASNPFTTAGDPTDQWRDEIWAYGLRNPYRSSFDRQTGDLWIGDVGQNSFEEVDYQPADSTGGENYGWNRFEGNDDNGAGDPPADYVPPVYVYSHGGGAFQGSAINGGYVYRGPDADLQGLYFFSDSSVDNVWTLDFDPDTLSATPDNVNTELGSLFSSVQRMVSFGEDAVGNLYIVDYSGGAVYRILTDNDVLYGDYNNNGFVDAADYTAWRDAMTAGASTLLNRDPNNTGPVDEDDFLSWRAHFGESLDPGAGAGEAASAPVPEPASILMLAQLLCLLATRPWYNRK
jgi:glucose/arabinose dehydrogenase